MVDDDVLLTHALLDGGPASIESRFDDALAAPGVVAGAIEAAADGADAIVVDCMADTGVAAAREAVAVPVVGAAESSMLLASMLATRWSIVTVLDAVVPLLDDLAATYRMHDRLTRIRTVGIPVLELHEEARLHDALARESLAAVERDGAHAVVLGCTGMRGTAQAVAAVLAQRGQPGIPVLDPVAVALRQAVALVRLGLVPSRRSFPPRREKPVIPYTLTAPGPST